VSVNKDTDYTIHVSKDMEVTQTTDMDVRPATACQATSIDLTLEEMDALCQQEEAIEWQGPICLTENVAW
jgi:hypothetical protein